MNMLSGAIKTLSTLSQSSTIRVSSHVPTLLMTNKSHYIPTRTKVKLPSGMSAGKATLEKLGHLEGKAISKMPTISKAVSKELGKQVKRQLTEEQKDRLFQAALEIGVDAAHSGIEICREKALQSSAQYAEEPNVEDIYRNGYEEGVRDTQAALADADRNRDSSNGTETLSAVLSQLSKEELLSLLGQVLAGGSADPHCENT